MAKAIEKEKDAISVEQVIDELAAKANVALKEMEDFDQEKVDHIVHEMAMAALDKHMMLAKMAVEETGRGIVEDKAIKNMYASEYIWNSIKHDKTVGVIGEDKQKGLIEVAGPVGVVCGVTPTTNPTSTTIFKSMIALKTGNPIVLHSIQVLKNVQLKLHVSFVMLQSQRALLKTVSNGSKSHRSTQLQC